MERDLLPHRGRDLVHRLGVLGNVAEAPVLARVLAKIDVIALDPRIDVARGGPIIPLSRHLADARRVRRGEVAGFGPIVRHVEKLPGPAEPRSEEPTAELQSLMRNSYAVFFLK